MIFLLLDCNNFFAKLRYENCRAVLFFGDHYLVEYGMYPDEIGIKEIWLNDYPNCRVLILGGCDD